MSVGVVVVMMMMMVYSCGGSSGDGIPAVSRGGVSDVGGEGG